MKFVLILRNVNSVLLQFDVILTNFVLTSPHQINRYIWRRKSNNRRLLLKSKLKDASNNALDTSM
jgi:hypothetical protein